MKFRTLGRALLLTAGVAGSTLGLTSCSNDHTVGYVYVLGTNDASTTGGQISAFKEDNNNGTLSAIAAPSVVSTGGANPVRAVVPSGNRFLYVLNSGTSSVDTNATLPSGQPNPDYGVTTYSSSSIQLFSIGGYGQLSQQLSYNSQGFGSERIAVDAAGAHIYVLDRYANVGQNAITITPNQAGVYVDPTQNPMTPNVPGNYPCQDPSNPNIFHPVGSITVFTIDTTTGRLELQTNATNNNLTYFPVGCFPIDFRLSSSFLYTMDQGSPSVDESGATANDQQTIYVYGVTSSTGQLTPAQTSVTHITSNNSSNITAITGDSNPNVGVGATKYLYLLDQNASLIYAYTISSNGAPIAISGSPFGELAGPGVVNAASQAGGPTQSYTDSTGKYLYVTNAGPTDSTNPNADVAGFVPDPTTGNLNTVVQTSGFILGTVSGPVCIFEDPTNQYLYVAGSVDNSITGRRINPSTGVLNDLNKTGTVPTVQTPTWCLAVSSTQ